jgi:hypothetical protein
MATTPVGDPVLKFDAIAFDKLVYMRDYRAAEVAMFGITHKDNPLHVYDVQLVKQVVNSASADCDPDYMADFIVQNIEKGIMPINCERIWCHTHPMTGEGSANPSGKDMNTWNHEDNSHKNFMVMLILSKTGQITCKLRIRSNWEKEVPGMSHPYVFEKDIKVEIVKDATYDEKIKAAMINKFGTQAVEALGNDAVKVLGSYIKTLDIYPEFVELHKQYEELVSQEVVGHGGHYIGAGVNQHRTIGFDNRKKAKKNPTERNVPEMLLTISEHKESFATVTDEEFGKILENFNDIADIEDLQLYEEEFLKENPQKPNDYVSVILGGITASLLDTNGDSIIIKHKVPDIEKRCLACVSAGMLYPKFKAAAIDINIGGPAR